MEHKGLLFIPDISGFTRFVSETEIEHSRLIIQELLELLINANQIGLDISEIEGDAILFYKFGAAPDLEALYRQVADMFCAFHRHLLAYEHRRFCQCKACQSAINLSLKVITHYGEFTGYTVKQFSKLIGKDVIVAHQLLKNDIDQHEYWLVTDSLLPGDPPAGPAEWMQWMRSAKQTESGAVGYHFTQLGPLKNEIPAEPSLRLELARKVKVLSFSEVYDTDIRTLFHATGDFHYRSRWQQDVKEVTELDHLLPRVGMRCRCLLENGQVILYSSSYSYHPDRIEFSETDEQRHSSVYYTLEKLDDRKTQLTIDYYLRNNMADRIGFRLWRQKKTEENYRHSLRLLASLVQEIRLPSLEEGS